MEARIVSLGEFNKEYRITSTLTEDQVWFQDIEPELAGLPTNVISIWQFCFTEIFNNAIDHSQATKVAVDFTRNADYTEILVADDGVGIFRKIEKAMDLLDSRHVILELVKGKLTTDPARHVGQGIFFSERLLDGFSLGSGIHDYTCLTVDGTLPSYYDEPDGTVVSMRLSNSTGRVASEVFEAFSADGAGGFTKTVVPVKLARYGDEELIARSQAKRLMARLDLFHIVELDFAGIDSIGQAFADEIFRVFASTHPNLRIEPKNAGEAVARRIGAVRRGLAK